MDANLYISNNFSDNAIQEYYKLKEQLALTKQEQKIIEKIFKRKEQTMFDEDLQLNYQNYLEPMITAIKHGHESYDDIEQFSGISRHNLSVYFGDFYKYLIKANLINPETGKTQKQAVIDFIGSRLLDTNYSESEAAASEEKEKPAHVIASDSVAIQNKKPEKKRFSLDVPLPRPEEKFPLRNEPLTEAEQKVLDLLVEGYDYKKCAEYLILSPLTIKSHISAIFQKRDYHSLQDLLVCEYQKKITEVEQNQPEPKKVNFNSVKEKLRKKIDNLHAEIDKYQEKLKAIEILETELSEECEL